MERVQAAACSSGRMGGSQQLSRPCRPSAQLFRSGRRQARVARRQQAALASMGIGFTSDLATPPSGELLLPGGPDYGLSVKQMQVLGLTHDASFGAKLPEVRAVSEAGGVAGVLQRPARAATWACCDCCRCMALLAWRGAVAQQRKAPGVWQRPQRRRLLPPPPSPAAGDDITY